MNMPKLKIMGDLVAFANQIERLGGPGLDKCTKPALWEGARIIADEIESRIQALPGDTFGLIRGTTSVKGGREPYAGVTDEERKDLSESLGVSVHRREDDGWSVAIGFQGYARTQRPTKKYPNGIPNQMIARSIESGSSVRRKTPFVRPAVSAKKAEAEQAIQKAFEERAKEFIKE